MTQHGRSWRTADLVGSTDAQQDAHRTSLWPQHHPTGQPSGCPVFPFAHISHQIDSNFKENNHENVSGK